MLSSQIGRTEIESAAGRIKPYIVETPLVYASSLSDSVGVDVFLKCENLQRTGAFKLRGALNKLLWMQEQGALPAGVITASSGNHGQAVAYAAKLLGIACTVVVPETVLPVKEQAILGFGAKVIRCGTTSSQRIELASTMAHEQQLSFVPPYDDPLIMAGQGTVGAEIAHQCPQVQSVIAPVGGGGLLSGVAIAIKTLLPDTKVYGAEPSLANDTYLSRQAGQRIDIGETTTIADGLRTSHPGELTFPVVQNYVDEILLADEATIAMAMRHILMQAKLLVEPSGSTSVAAFMQATEKPLGPVVCVLSGGNVEWETIRDIFE